jgi:Helicase HerA, central domain
MTGATRGSLSQPTRLFIAIGYLGILAGLASFLNGQILPPFGLDGLWFYASFAALIIGEFLIEPFFATPADAIGNGVGLLLAVGSTSVAGAAVAPGLAEAGRSALLVYGAATIGMGVVAIALKDLPGKRGRVAGVTAWIVRRVGRARLVFGVLVFASGYAVFANDAGKLAALYLTWFAIQVAHPLEGAAYAIATLRRRPPPREHGVVEGFEDPGILVARFPRSSGVALGSEVSLGASEKTIGTVVDVTTLGDELVARIALVDLARASLGDYLTITDEGTGLVIGHVAEGTVLDEIHVRTVPAAARLGLLEGRLVDVAIGATRAIYQITAAETFGRSDEQLRRDLVRVVGRKLGAWSQDTGTFVPVPWLPTPGAPVSLLANEDFPFDPELIGRVPGTSYGVSVDIDQLVTHNAAILGILGVGKTRLAWELIARMLAHGLKVVCLDISDRYAGQFDDTCSTATQGAAAAWVDSRIITNYPNRAVRNGEAGNVKDFQVAIGELLDRFMAGDERLLIINPNRFRVSRMEGKPFSGNANQMVDLTMVEVTRIVTERLLVIVQNEERDPMDESARLCLVLEEAHSLVPEWNSVAFEQEQHAVNGTTRAILQGRKYGFGCLLVTQRTANVTKSILNQCNTVFGMRAFDATGMGFLENYIGPAYARLLASLDDRQAVVFGRGSSCKAPLIVDLNDTDDFRAGFWATFAARIPVTSPPNEALPTEPPTLELPPDDEPDDLPF